MLVGSQAGNAPNDVAGLFFLLAAIAFLVNGAASAHAAREAAAARRTEGYTATPTGELEPGVVEDVPVEGDPRALATVGAGPLFLAGLAAGLGIGTKITLLAALGVLTIGIAILGGRRHWLRALGDLARRHADHLRASGTGATSSTRSTRSRRSTSSGRSTCPAPTRSPSIRASRTA